MLDYINGLLVLAHRQRFCYFDADNFFKDGQAFEGVKEEVVSEDMLKTVTLSDDKKIISTQEIGEKESCLVIEDLDTHNLRYLHLKKNT